MKRKLSCIYTITLITLLILFSCQAFATNRFIDGAVGTSGNGLSWGTAWKGISNIVWSSINPGDTIFFSTGTYSGSIAPPATKKGTATNYIVLTSAKYAYHSVGMADHNGTVVLTGGINFSVASGSDAPSYIKFKGFEMTTNNINFNCDYPALMKGIYLESIYLHDYGSQFGIRVITYSDSLIIDSCIVIDCLDPEGSCAGQRDCVHFNYDGNTYPRNSIIRNCWMEMRSQDPTAHNDVIQSAHADGFTIYNNIFISDSVNSPKGGGMPLILSSNDNDENNYPPVLIFNNFCYMGGLWYDNASDGRVLMTRHDGGAQETQQSPTYIFNNTLVNSGPRDQVVDQEYHIDFFSNNINASFCPPDAGSPNDWRTGDTAPNKHGWYNSLSANSSSSYTSIPPIHMYRDSTRHNLFWRQDNNQGFFGGSFYTTGSSTFSPSNWSTWISGGGTGVNANPLFEDNFGHEPDQSALTGRITGSSPAIGAGENLTYLANYLASTYNLPNDIKAAMLKDMNGKSRGTSWDIGAYQFVAGAWTPPDTTATVTFTPVTNAELNSYHLVSGTLTGADSTFHVYTATADSFKIGIGGAFNTAPKTAVSGDVIYISNIGSGLYSTSTTASVIVSGTTRSFSITTKAETYIPPSGNGGWGKQSNGRGIFTSDGKRLITR